MQKDDLNVYIFQNKNWCSLKSDWWLSEDLFIGRILIKNMGVRGLISEKTEASYAGCYETAEATTISYFITGNFLQYIILCLCLRIIRTSNQRV